MGGKGSGTLNASLVKLDGTLISKDGKESKTSFFDFLDIPLDDYSDIEMSPEAAIKFRNTVIRMKVGMSAAMPLICSGPERCPHGKKCAFSEGIDSNGKIKGKFPLTHICPVENNLINLWTKSYIEDLAVDPSSISQMSLVNRLVEIDLLDYRANMGLSGQRDEEAGTLLKTTITETENSTTETVNIHPLLEAKSRFSHERLKVLEALVASPREQYKKAQALGKSDDSDAAKHMSEMAELINSMKTAAKQIKSKNTYAKMLEEANEIEKENKENDITLADWNELDDDI